MVPVLLSHLNDSSPLSTGEIKARAVRGVSTTFTVHLLSQFFRLGLGVFLARRLTPDDYGLVAIVTAITGFCDMVRDQGLSNVLIQSRDLDETRLDTLFWFVLALILLEVAVLAALAPAVAWFYRRPELAALTLGLALGSAVSGLAGMPLA